MFKIVNLKFSNGHYNKKKDFYKNILINLTLTILDGPGFIYLNCFYVNISKLLLMMTF